MSAVQKRLKMALDRQKEAAEKRSTQQQHQQKQAEGLIPKMKVINVVSLSFLSNSNYSETP